MEKKTKKTLNGALQGLLTRLEKGEKFVLAQAPAVCKELVTEMMINNATGLVFALAPIVGGLFMINGTCDGKTDTELLHGIGYALVGAGCIVAVVVINELLTLKLCPKISLMRKIRDLLSTDKSE